MFRKPGLLPLLAACLALAPDAAADIAAAYPEGPLVSGRRVLFAEMHKHRIITWDGSRTETFYRSAGCGPTAIAPYGEGYAVLCHRLDEIHLISRNGQRRARLRHDRDGRPFDHPNDASADGRGGVWFTASGIFGREAPSGGALLYLGPDGVITRLAEGLHYANGVYFDRNSRQLFVSEHLAGRILVYPELAPGRPGHPAVFRRFAAAKGAPGGTGLTGPDGLETDEKGNLYVALYGAGVLFILSPEGKTRFRLAGQEPLITNVAIRGCELIVTGARRAAREPFPGSVRTIANPVCGRYFGDSILNSPRPAATFGHSHGN